MPTIEFPVECPKCRSKDVHLPADSESGGEDHLICGGCGYRAEKVEFVAKEAALDKLAEIAKEAFSGIPGFRKK